MVPSKSEKGGEICCTVIYADPLNRRRLPGLRHHVRIEIPEAIFSAEKFLMVVTNAGRAAQCLKPFVEFRSQTLGCVRAVLGFWPPESERKSASLFVGFGAAAFLDHIPELIKDLIAVDQLTALGLADSSIEFRF